MGDSLEVVADAAELAGAEPLRFLFAARRAIGYLFLKPVSAASFVVSLMRQVPEAFGAKRTRKPAAESPSAQLQWGCFRVPERRAESEPTEVRAVTSRT